MLKIIENVGKRVAICICTECGNTYDLKCKYTAKKSILGSVCNKCKYGLSNLTEITQKALKNWLSYDPITGLWKHKRNSKSGLKGEIATAKHSSGYLTIRIGSKDYLAHRMAFIYMQDSMPEQVDHINHNKQDNSWDNLREVNNQENHMNEPLSSNSTTGITGVALHKPTGKYRAYIMVNKKHIHLGLFTSINEAKLAREKANKTYGFHNNHGNKVSVTNWLTHVWASPNHINKVRRNYNEILSEIAESNLMETMLNEVSGYDAPYDKEDNDIANLVLEANYSLS